MIQLLLSLPLVVIPGCLVKQPCCLEENGFYVLGDSLYNLTQFVLVPYLTDKMQNDSGDMCNAYNFFLSLLQISIKCAFGELVRRWGILWQSLHFNLTKSQRIIQPGMYAAAQFY